jgi:copper chaperone CopZ
MKTSVIEVHDMLSVLSVDEVEKRIGEVPGVESVTVNYAAKSATVRYDETRLEVADLKSAVRQKGYESAAPATPSVGDGHEGHTAPGAPPSTPVAAAPKPSPAAPSATPTPTSAAPKPAPAAAAASAAPAGDEQQDKTAPQKS